jgi:isopenicillin N synthase-like dioxygenase
MKDAIVLNIGMLLEKISNHKIKATYHRVLDIGTERFSSPYFLCPKFSARINENLLDSSRKSCEDYDYEFDPANEEEMKSMESFGSYVCSKMTGEYKEYKGF